MNFDSKEILDSLSMAIYVKNSNRKFVYVNPAFCKMVGIEADRLIGQNEEVFYDFAFAEKYRAADAEILQGNGQSPVEKIEQNILGAPNKPQFVHVVKTAIRDGDKIKGIIGIFTPITDSILVSKLSAAAAAVKQAEEQLDAFQNPPAQLLPKPRVFISYKHATSGHQNWVKQLATDLIEKHGIECLLDQFDLDFGESIPAYMQRIQTEATHVLFIVTPECVESVEANSGGVSFEIQLATSLRQTGNLKIIPLLRSGSQTPAYVKSHRYIDFREDTVYHDMVKQLADSILSKRKRPTLNSKQGNA